MDPHEYIAELEAENSKLRVVEEQFWVMLNERHNCQSDKVITSGPIPNGPVGSNLRVENERLTTALAECMELLMSAQGAGSRMERGPVAAFLSWCQIEEQRNNEKPVPIVHADRGQQDFARTKQLNEEVSRLASECRQLQDELDRADLSRLQALEDADRLQNQVAVLAEQVLELKSAALAERSKAERHAAAASQAIALKTRLAQRDDEVSALEAEVQRLRRTSVTGGSDLAAEAARIRAELAKRSES